MLKLKFSDFTEKQLFTMRNSNARINIFSGAVRSGKTIASIFRFIHYIKYGPRGSLIIVGKSERTIIRNIISIMQKILGKSLNFNQGKGEIIIGSRLIYVCGANDERAEGKIRGLTIAGALVDEATLIPRGFWTQLLARLSIKGSQLFATTNTDSPHHFLKKDYIDRKGELDLSYHQFKLEDNTFLDKDYISNLKKEYQGLYYRRFIDGIWCLAEGAIYNIWDSKIYMQDTSQINFKNPKQIIGVDYGITNPTSFLKFRFDDINNIALIKEMHLDKDTLGLNITDDILANKFEEFAGNDKIEMVYCDPSATSFKNKLRSKGKWNIMNADNSVLKGIQFVSTLLSNNKLIVDKTCKETDKGFSSYVWDTKAQQKGIDQPLKVDDHEMDALRYALYTHFCRGNGEVSKKNMMTKLYG